MKVYLITLAVALALIAFFMGGIYTSLSLLAFINSTAYAAILLVLAGCVLLIVGGGYFSGIAYSFKRFFDKSTRTGEMISEMEEDELEDPSEPIYRPTTFTLPYTYPFIVVGGILFIFSLILSYTIY